MFMYIMYTVYTPQLKFNSMCEERFDYLLFS